MKKYLNSVIVSIPLTALVACGTFEGQNAGNVILDQEEEFSELGLVSESEELIEDHIEELSGVLSLEDETVESSQIQPNNPAKTPSPRQKLCSTENNVLSLKTSLSRERTKERKKNRINGPISTHFVRNESNERTYTPHEESELAVKCSSEQGPVELIAEKIAGIEGMKIEIKNNSKRERTVQKDGKDRFSRVVEFSGSRTIIHGSASLVDEKINYTKTISIDSKSIVHANGSKKGPRVLENIYRSEEGSPLKVEVQRNVADKKLVYKLITSGTVTINRGTSKENKISYENVKFSAVCKPESGQLVVTKMSAKGNQINLKIAFKDGEAFLSRDGGEEKKMESLNLKLESCRD